MAASLSPSPAAQQMLSQLDAPYRPKPTAFPVSLPRLYQSASALLSQARTYHREGAVEHAYLLYRRFMYVVLHSIRQHPQYGLKRYSAEKEQYRQLGHQAVDALEQLRKEIILKYQDLPLLQPDDDDDNEEAQEEQQPAAAEEERKDATGSGQAEVRGDALDAALQQRMSALLLASEDQKEEERKDDGPDTLSDSLPSAYRPSSPPSQSLLASAFTLSPSAEPSAPPLDDLSRPSHDVAASAASSTPWQPAAGGEPAVGVVDSSNRYKWANLRTEESKLKPAAAPADPVGQLALRPAPSPPVPGLPASPFSFSPAAALRPPLRAAAVPPVGAVPPAASVPRPFSLSRRASFLSPPFRPLHIPVSVVAAFARLAMPNTMRDIETCAVLAGTLSRSTLRVTHCILPPQTATASTCSATDELALLSCQSRLDLLTLGWIHTHPSQSLFLSSVDLHTQYGYQVMLQEAVAIVVTGRGEDGTFSLGKDGMDTLAACGKSGFHEHDTRPGVGLLYAQAKHVVKEMQGSVTFIDLRKGEQGAAAAGAGAGAAAAGARGRGGGGSSLYPGMHAAHAH